MPEALTKGRCACIIAERRVCILIAVVGERRTVHRRRGESDVELIAEVARGDRHALATLYDRHGGLMRTIAQRMLREAPEAEDTVHDVFLEVWQRAGDYDPARSTVRKWMLLRLQSRCLDRLRRAERREMGLRRAEPAASESEPARQGDALDGQRVLGALACLRSSQRRALVLTYFYGMSSREIAVRLGVPVGTVKSRISAGLAHLRRAMMMK